MSWFGKHWAKSFSIGGTVITIIGLATLPEDFDVWRDRVGDFMGMVQDNPLAGAALALGIALVIIGNWELLSTPIRGSKRWRTDQELGDELHSWLRHAGFSLLDQPLQPGISFIFTATDTGNRPTTIIKLAGEPGVQLQTLVRPEGAHRAVIETMTDDQSATMIEEIGIELVRFGVGFDARDLLGTGIVLNYPLLLADSLTQWQFLERVRFVARAILLVQAVVTRHVRLTQMSKGVPNVTPVPLSTPDTASPQPEPAP